MSYGELRPLATAVAAARDGRWELRRSRHHGVCEVWRGAAVEEVERRRRYDPGEPVRVCPHRRRGGRAARALGSGRAVVAGLLADDADAVGARTVTQVRGDV